MATGRRALILGVAGQDGSYLAELLLHQGYEVYGTTRRSSVDNLWRVAHLRDRLILYEADLTDPLSVHHVMSLAYEGGEGPLEVYNMADQDSVGSSVMTPGYSVAVTAGGAGVVMEAAMTVCDLRHSIKVLQPVSATVFGRAPAETPQTTETPLDPGSPYACAKAHAWHLARYYRRLGLWVSCPVYYNHDSERRGPGYLLQRIARGEGLTGDLDTTVDVGYAPEYVEAAWKMLQHPEPIDLCIGTGAPYPIRELVAYRDHLEGSTGLRPYPGCPAHIEDRWSTPDVKPAAHLIGWRARTDAAGVLERLVAHHSRRAGGEDTQTAGGPPPGLVAGT